MKNLFNNVTKGKKRNTNKKGQKSPGLGSRMSSFWTTHKASVGSTLKSTAVVGVGTAIGMTVSKYLGRK